MSVRATTAAILSNQQSTCGSDWLDALRQQLAAMATGDSSGWSSRDVRIMTPGTSRSARLIEIESISRMSSAAGSAQSAQPRSLHLSRCFCGRAGAKSRAAFCYATLVCSSIHQCRLRTQQTNRKPFGIEPLCSFRTGDGGVADGRGVENMASSFSLLSAAATDCSAVQC